MKIKLKFIVTSLILFSLTMSCASKKDYLITIKTSFGDIKLILFDDTPLHKQNFINLAEAGRYDGTNFHRVMNDFMIQGGDVNTKEGTAITPEARIPEEIHTHHIHTIGAVAAARTNNPERKSSECQFYIVQGKKWTEDALLLDQSLLNQYLRQLLAMPEYQELRQEFIELQRSGTEKDLEEKMFALRPVVEKEFEVSLSKDMPQDRVEAYTTVGGTPHLDDEYTVFGLVVEGMDVVDEIARQETDDMDKPIEEITMVVEVEKVRRAKISKIYGYQYPESL